MTLHQQFIRVAKRHPSRVCIKDRSLNRTLTYRQALIAAIMLSRKLKAYPDAALGIMIPNSAGSVLTILGTLMAGKLPVMINYSTGAANNCEYAQKKVGFTTIVTSKALLERIGCKVVPGMVFIEEIMKGIGTADKLGAALTSLLPLPLLSALIHRGEDDDNAVILFTSGSEKDPKAVQLTHRNLSSNVQSVNRFLTLSEEDVIPGILPYFHVFGHNINLWLPLLNGMKLVTYANPLDYRTVSTIVREEKITLFVGTPVFFAGYLRQSDPGDFASCRIIIAGADKVPDKLREAFKQKHGVELFEGYGATETSPVVSANIPGISKPGSIGRVLPGVEARVAALDSLQELPRGSEGRILVRGDLVMKGYLGDPEETAKRIVDGWYDTGDMGVMDEDGFLWHRGRLRRFVKVGGEMVSLTHVESVLAKLLPEDVDVCVVDVPDPHKGAKLIAAVTREVDRYELLPKLTRDLSAIAVPREFIVVESLPKMGSGKIDFRGAAKLVEGILAQRGE